MLDFFANVWFTKAHSEKSKYQNKFVDQVRNCM